jgi:selenium-binding protein 1
LWTKGEKKAKFGYDFWYQPHWDVMISTEWGAPKSFKKGFALPDTQDEGSSSVHMAKVFSLIYR